MAKQSSPPADAAGKNPWTFPSQESDGADDVVLNAGFVNPLDVDANPADNALSAPPPFTVSQIVQQLRTSWGGSFEGTTESWAGGGAINYYIGGAPFASGTRETPFTTSMTPLMQARAELAFELWDDLIARDLNRSFTAASGQIQFEYATRTLDNNNQLSTAGGTYSRPNLTNGGTNQYGTTNYNITRDEIWLNSNWDTHNQDSDLFFGGYGFITYIHEIGHSLGLSHPGSYNANGNPITYDANAEYAQDTEKYTVMSYFGAYQPNVGWDVANHYSNWWHAATPQLHDIAAIQAIYGADMTTRSGNTTYGFNSTADRDVYNFNLFDHPIFAIWDGGGNDTIDTSGYSAVQRIDLNPGTFSDIGGMVQNIAIAFNVTIEAAIGGSNADVMLGNSADNTFRGNRGNDTIDGAGGIDSAIFSGSRSAYTLTELGGGSVQVSGLDGVDTLSNVERLVFDDMIVTWPLDVVTGTLVFKTAPARLIDLDGDKKSDVVWRNDSGLDYAWLMNGLDIKAEGGQRSVDSSWHMRGGGDFDGDGKGDILWRQDGGEVYLWNMNGTDIKSEGAVRLVDIPWHIDGTGDFGGDGREDILWRHDSGEVYVWNMNGASVISEGSVRSVDNAWHINATGDFNGDGKFDVLWRHDNGQVYLWNMNGAGIQSEGSVRGADTSWHIAGAGDFDGDGKDDILWRQDGGQVYVWLMDGQSVKGEGGMRAVDNTWHIQATGDVDGDGKDDVLWQHDSGLTYIWEMNGVAVKAEDSQRVADGGWHILGHDFDLI